MFAPLLVLAVSCFVLSVAHTDTEDYRKYQQFEMQECGPNEVFKQCIGCPPEDSCYDRNQIGCGFSFLSCHSGCVCKEGFIRKTLGRECIPKEECGGPCAIFEQYSECRRPSYETCSSILNPLKSYGDNKESCTPGCTCWHGYYRENENSSCLPRCLCPELENSPECASRRIHLE